MELRKEVKVRNVIMGIISILFLFEVVGLGEIRERKVVRKMKWGEVKFWIVFVWRIDREDGVGKGG